MTEKSNIYYISSHSLFNEGAATNRLLSIIRGLNELGYNAKVLHSIPTKELYFKAKNIKKDWIVSFKTRKKKYSFIGKLTFSLSSIYTAYRCYKEVVKSSKTNKTYVVSFDSYFLNRYIFFLLKWKKKIICTKEYVEYPVFEREPMNILKRYYYQLNYYLDLRAYNSFFAISTNLQNYIKAKAKNKTVGLIPICVEADRFTNSKESCSIESPYIAYCGNMSNDKDGVNILLDAFNIFNKKYPQYKLVLIGSGKGSYFENIKKKALNLSSSQSIIFTGNIHRNQMPSYLCNAHTLALARPANKQAEGGLPTKLGEYLSTGIPVVITDVSDIKMYLEKAGAACICTPGSADEFAEKLIYLANNPIIAKEIGLQGKKVALELFDYKSIAKQLTKFLENL